MALEGHKSLDGGHLALNSKVYCLWLDLIDSRSMEYQVFGTRLVPSEGPDNSEVQPGVTGVYQETDPLADAFQEDYPEAAITDSRIMKVFQELDKFKLEEMCWHEAPQCDEGESILPRRAAVSTYVFSKGPCVLPTALRVGLCHVVFLLPEGATRSPCLFVCEGVEAVSSTPCLVQGENDVPISLCFLCQGKFVVVQAFVQRSASFRGSIL